MIFRELSIRGLFAIQLEPVSDSRGWFARTYCKEAFARAGFHGEFVQSSESFSPRRGTFRGLHYQLPPLHEAKLVRCVAGAITDVVVDLRRGSPTFLRHSLLDLTAGNFTVALIPPGLAHGFLTRTDDVLLVYHHSQVYSPAHARGVRYDDPRLGLHLQEPVTVISQGDRAFDLLPDGFDGIALEDDAP